METDGTPLCIRLNALDNVAIVANDGGLPAGTALPGGVVLREHIPQAHKAALSAIREGEAVIRYGVPIGFALKDIPGGGWVTEDLLRMPPLPVLEDIPLAEYAPPPPPPLEGYSFAGYRNPDGTAGTRNILAIGTTVQCAAGVVEQAVARIRAELLPRYPHVDDVAPIQHVYGCGVAIEAAEATIPIRTLTNILKNPNFGGMPMIVGLGCEKLTPERLLPTGSMPLQDDGPYVICLQDAGGNGYDDMIGAIMYMAEKKLRTLDRRRREECPASLLRVGLQCGGSDAFSGVTANPAVGYAADLVVRAGGTVFFSEVTEVRDGIAQLVRRAATRETGEALKREMAWYDAYLARSGVDRSANTSPGNKKGGLNNITEKTMGSIVKSGSFPIRGVFRPGERIPPEARGLYFVATPASDFVCGTLQMAAGMNMHVFTTGRGSPYGLREIPVVKVVSRSELAGRWRDLVDMDAGRIVTGGSTIEKSGWELFRIILEAASGKKTRAEALGLHNSLALFNPGPVS
ncbi:MAG: galactarate dehydratase [Desulfovibrio sp.]|nr:galactarate dehydratase [Desulfovibrio sp.]